jgi:hypothetical protein
MLNKKPVSGLGLGNYKSTYNLRQADYFKSHGSSSERMLAGENYNPFNAFLGLGIEEGIIGLALFVVLVILFFSQKRKKDETSIQGMDFYIKCSLFSLLLISCSSYSFEEPFLFICFFSLLGISASKSGLRTMLLKKVKFSNLILIAFSMVGFNNVYYADKWLRVRPGMPGGANIDLYKELYPHLIGNDLFLSDYAASLAFDKKYNVAENIMEKSKALLPSPAKFLALAMLNDQMNQPVKAEDELKEAIEITPSRFGPRFALFNHYVQIKRYPQAGDIAEEIEQMEVNIPSMEVDRIRDSVSTFINLHERLKSSTRFSYH